MFHSRPLLQLKTLLFLSTQHIIQTWYSMPNYVRISAQCGTTGMNTARGMMSYRHERYILQQI